MTLSQISLTFRVLGSRSRSLWLFLEKNCHRSSVNIYQWILIQHTKAEYDNISSKFDFQDPGLKVKFTVAIFRKKKLGHRSYIS